MLSSNRCSLSKVGAGKVTNLVSNDAIRMEEIGSQFMFFTIAFLENFIAFALMWFLLGWQSLSGIFAVIVLLFIQVMLSKQFATFRAKQTVATDKRLSAMNDIVKGIRMVKMCGWEDNYSELIRTLRRYQTMEHISFALKIPHRVPNIRGILLSLKAS